MSENKVDVAELRRISDALTQARGKPGTYYAKGSPAQQEALAKWTNEHADSLLDQLEQARREVEAMEASIQHAHLLRLKAEYEASVARLRGALEKIANARAWGAPEKWEETPAELRQFACQALQGE